MAGDEGTSSALISDKTEKEKRLAFLKKDRAL